MLSIFLNTNEPNVTRLAIAQQRPYVSSHNLQNPNFNNLQVPSSNYIDPPNYNQINFKQPFNVNQNYSPQRNFSTPNPSMPNMFKPTTQVARNIHIPMPVSSRRL